MPQGRHSLFRFGAFIAARGHRLSINVRISPPEHQHVRMNPHSAPGGNCGAGHACNVGAPLAVQRSSLLRKKFEEADFLKNARLPPWEWDQPVCRGAPPTPFPYTLQARRLLTIPSAALNLEVVILALPKRSG